MCLPKRVIFNALVLPEKMVLLQMLLQSFVKMFFCNPSHKPWGNPFLRYCTSAQYHFLIPQKTVLRIPRFPILEAFSLFFSVKTLPMVCKLLFSFQKSHPAYMCRVSQCQWLYPDDLRLQKWAHLSCERDWQELGQAFLPLGLMRGSLAIKIPSIFLWVSYILLSFL